MGVFETLKKYKWMVPLIEKADRITKSTLLKNFRLKKKNFYPEGEYKADIDNLIKCMLCPNMCRFDCGTLQASQSETMSPGYKARIGYYLSIGKIDYSDSDFVDLMYMCSNEENCKIWCPFDFSVVSFLETVRDDINDKGFTPNYIKEQVNKLITTHTIENYNIFKESIKSNINDIKSSGESEVFYYVGCESLKLPEIVNANIKLLNKANVKSSMDLGERWCCGAPLFNTRHLELAKQHAIQNKKLIESSGAKILITDCPGCAETLLNRYNKIGIKLKVEVLHIVKFLKMLFDQKRLSFDDSKENPFENIVFHDPCILARNLNIINEPREILKKIKTIELREAIQNKEETHCCGWSGTLHWAKKEITIKESQNRIIELLESGANTIISACPLCELGLLNSLDSNEVKNVKIKNISSFILDYIK